MTPDVVVDIGNSRMKWGRVPLDGYRHVASLPHDDPRAWDEQLAEWRTEYPVRWAAASVNPPALSSFLIWAGGRGERVCVIDRPELVPIMADVDEPGRVGIDRLLNAVAARVRVPAGGPIVVIDVGSAVTVDLVDERGVFRGGAILPGPRLLAQSLHAYTAKLPDLPIHEVPNIDLPGRNTRDAITAGIMAALMGGCQMLVDEYAALCSSPPSVLMAGGAVGYLIDYDFAPNVEVGGPFPLTLEGLRIAAEVLP